MQRTLTTVFVTAISIAFIAWGLTGGLSHVRAGISDHVDTGSVVDPPAPALTVRLLDVGQGDATYIHNGDSRVIIDGGPDVGRFGTLLDSLGLNGTTIDVVVLTHQHYDHYNGLLALFDSRRNIKIRYVFENKDAAAATTLARLRDSIIARIHRDSLIYRDTDDPCANGAPSCTITMRGGARLRIMRPPHPPNKPNNRSTAVELLSPDSTFTMWLAGDAEHDEIASFEADGYLHPGMHVDVLKADHHGSCNGVTARYLELLHPTWVVASLGAHNDYGHMHEQAKALYRNARIPWYRTDQNGTITIRTSGKASPAPYTIAVGHGTRDMNGPSDRSSHQPDCAEF